MATFAPAESVGLYRGLELRRSKRIHRPIRLMILGRDLEGQPYREKMSTVSLSLHGCCYQSWHNSRIGAEVELQLAEGSVNRSPLLRASVRYVRPPMSHSELFQIGVEFDAPQREWLIVQEETIVGPAPHMALALNPQRTASATEPKMPAAPPVAVAQQEDAIVERVTIMTNRLIAVLQGTLQSTAENAVNAVRSQLEETVTGSIRREVATQLDGAVRQALYKIDEISTAKARPESSLLERLEQMMRSSYEGIRQVDTRLKELGGHWEDQREEQRQPLEEVVARLEKLCAATQRELIATKDLVAKCSSGVHSLPDALDRSKDKEVVAQEASAQLDASAAGVRALLHRAASDTLEEFRRQLELQMRLAICEIEQRLSCSLTTLEAETHTACDARRRAFENEVAQAAERAVHQFRSGIKAYLSASLVAAIEAVDKHAKTALTVLIKGPA